MTGDPLLGPAGLVQQVLIARWYRRDRDAYPQFQAYLRNQRPPTLIVWGAHDEIFSADGARAYLRDLPDAELHLLDTGHFALETHREEIASLTDAFLHRVLR